MKCDRQGKTVLFEWLYGWVLVAQAPKSPTTRAARINIRMGCYEVERRGDKWINVSMCNWIHRCQSLSNT